MKGNVAFDPVEVGPFQYGSSNDAAASSGGFGPGFSLLFLVLAW
jgi:hypothetical protein